MKKNEDVIIKALQDSGLNYEQSIVYYTLVKYGQKGTTVRKLNLELPDIERTAIYPILQRLIKKEYIIDLKSSETLKKAKLFIALDPSNIFNKILSRKKEEIKQFEKKEATFTEHLQSIYIREEEYAIDDISPFIQPYIKPLFEKRWKISKQIVEKGLKTFGYDFYEYHVNPPDAHSLIGYSGFHIYLFDYVHSDKREDLLSNPLLLQNFDIEPKFIVLQIKRKIRERFLIEFKINNVRIKESEMLLFGKNYPSLLIEIKPNKIAEYKKAFKSVILPMKNKVYFIWAVKEKTILEMFKNILRVENIPLPIDS